MTKSRRVSIFKHIPTLHTPRLTLRRMQPSDYRDMYEYACDPNVTRFLTWQPHPNPAWTMRYLAYVATRFRAGEFFDWAVVLRENQKMIGTCGFTSFAYEHNSAEIGYVLNPLYWGQGIALEAVQAIMGVGFRVLNLHRIEAKFILGNERSRRVMEKAGMSFEGYQREAMYILDGYKTIGVCSILFSEYLDK